MVKRNKRLNKSIESLKSQIEKHFTKLENEIKEENEIVAKYHIKEIDNSFLADLEKKMKFLGQVDEELLNSYLERLNRYKKELFE